MLSWLFPCERANVRANSAMFPTSLPLPAVAHSGIELQFGNTAFFFLPCVDFEQSFPQRESRCNQCVVRNAELSQCETVRNVSHGVHRLPKRAKCAKLVSHKP